MFRRFKHSQRAEFVGVTAHPDVDEAGVGPQLWADATLARLVGVGLDQLGHGGRHRVLRLPAHRRHLVLVDQAERDHLARDPVERVAGAPLRFFVLVAVSERATWVGPVLVEEPVHLDFDDRRSVAAAHALSRLLGGEVHRQRVHAVDAPAGDTEPLAAHRQPRIGGDLFDPGGHGVQVVLYEEAERQFPRRGEVHRLQHGTDLAGPVAEVADGQIGGATVLLGPGIPCAHWYPAPDDRVGAQRAGFEPLQVHGPAASAAEALREAEDLGQGSLQHPLNLGCHHRGRVNDAARDVRQRLGEKLVMTAVRSVDGVGGAQADNGSNRAAFLSDAGMRRPVHQTFAGQLEHRFLESADEVQFGEHGAQKHRVSGFPVVVGGRQFYPGGARFEALFAWHGPHLH